MITATYYEDFLGIKFVLVLLLTKNKPYAW